MDDHDIDGEHTVIEDAAHVANFSSPVGDGVAAGHMNVSEDEPVPPSSDGKYNSRASCWKHMTKKKVIEDGVVHYFAAMTVH
ncbi:hypothetical protein GUJ93_ZPchr0006g44009 [Zizania palustris]|uniref:Uncharacterized protein n=1 Tax=Zizania palustris TaxID=103762 RepID=A0A8J5SCW2_ZIZPA|nr:hypothetical protein GUJ93_ZPchr0006g44009 [Zizania palustris]